ncbi:MAG: hypothetical protein FMNOHCHN_03596 [Ignavibacteriaceae bacterium]|nr:hypothetical protein [Ignavibacteriaceae bacterium]GIL17950.1 MAG: hypothetical protein BroJett040_17010 [Oligoflexia bacterium]
MKELTGSHILSKLQQRVSVSNAKMLLDTAKAQSGVLQDNETVLEMEQAKMLCLKLINQGGPSFQVGQAIYKEYLQ